MHEQFGQLDELEDPLVVNVEVIGKCVAKVYYSP